MNNLNNRERLDAFLQELAELTKKYNLEIDGCGCCGSPAIDTREHVGTRRLVWTIAERLSYDAIEGRYTVTYTDD